jgi:type IV secretion system protein VirB9
VNIRAALLATTLLYSAPALAAIDPPAASPADGRIRSLVYDPNNPVEIYTAPGMSLRLEFGADEEVVDAGIVVSDQDTIAPDPAAPPPITTVSNPMAGQGPKIPSTCDFNMCRSVSGNIVYLKPVRPLDPQPLFIQTKRTNAKGVAEMVPYTFELFTKPVADKDGKPVPMVWGVRFTYPERAKQAQAAAWAKQRSASEATARDLAGLAHPVPNAPTADANFRYGYRGAASVQPDQAWDDGRTTFLRFNGNRRLPNIYNLLPDGQESIPASAPEPDAGGNTLRIARTEAKWFLRDGDEAGCLFDLGPDPDGRTAATVALQAGKTTR